MTEQPHDPVTEQELAVIEAALPAMLDGLRHGWGDVLTDHLHATTGGEQRLTRESLTSLDLVRHVLPRLIAEVRRLRALAPELREGCSRLRDRSLNPETVANALELVARRLEGKDA